MNLFKMMGFAAVGVGCAIAAPVVLPVVASAGAVAATAAGAAAAGVATAAGTATAVATGAVTAASAAAASTAVGGAVISGAASSMAMVGGAVGTIAGTAGISTVATIAGTHAGATAVGAIATATAVGATNATLGVKKMSEASSIKAECKAIVDEGRRAYEKEESDAKRAINKLENIKQEVWAQVLHFVEIFNKIQNLDIGNGPLKERSFQLQGECLNLDRIRSITPASAIQGGIGSLTGGQIIGAAMKLGIQSTATASTGTAISALHGAAAYNAYMASLGGGSLASGGLGMAVGTKVASVMGGAPAVAIGGIFLNSKGSKNLKAAEESLNQAKKLAEDYARAEKNLVKVSKLAEELWEKLGEYNVIFIELINWLRELVERDFDANNYTDEETTKCYASYILAGILGDLATRNIFTVEENNEPHINEDEIKRAIDESDEMWEQYKDYIN